MTKEHETIKRLVEWANYMGGFDSQVWRDAKQLLDSADQEEKHDATRD